MKKLLRICLGIEFYERTICESLRYPLWVNGLFLVLSLGLGLFECRLWITRTSLFAIVVGLFGLYVLLLIFTAECRVIYTKLRER